MNLRYRVAPQALNDLEQIFDYLARSSSATAVRVLESIQDRFALLAREPRIGALRDELSPGVRSFTVGQYVIYYRPLTIGSETVEIVRVLHGARNVNDLF